MKPVEIQQKIPKGKADHDSNYKKFIAGMLLGFGSFIFGFFIAGIIQSKSFIKPNLSDLKSLPHIFIVQSGSMEPTLKTGSLVFSFSSLNYKKGDIITFATDNNRKNLVTHRIMEINRETSGSISYTTKGDANNTLDTYKVKNSDIVGKTFFTIPFLGYLANYVKTPQGFILFVIVPATIIVYEELKKLMADLLRALKKIDKNKDKNSNNLIHILNLPVLNVVEVFKDLLLRIRFPKTFDLTQSKHFPDGDVLKYQTNIIAYERNYHGLPKILTIIPIIGASLVFIAFSGSYFSDNEVSSGNVISAASSWDSTQASPTPIPTTNHIVISEIQVKGKNANQDAIELYNPTDKEINLHDWNLRKRTSSGNDSSIILLNDKQSYLIQPYGYFLWASNTDGYNTIVNADVTNSSHISENYSIALLDDKGNIIDQVGLGVPSGDQYVEGSYFADNFANNESVERKAQSTSTADSLSIGGSDYNKGNAYDSNNNSFDFVLKSKAELQNSISPIEIP
jgi:signal peptidase